MSTLALPLWPDCHAWQRVEVAGGEGGCPGLCGRDAWLQRLGPRCSAALSPEVVGDGAATVLAAPLLVAMAVDPARYGRGAVPGLTGMARAGLTVPRSSTGCYEGLSERKSSP